MKLPKHFVASILHSTASTVLGRLLSFSSNRKAIDPVNTRMVPIETKQLEGIINKTYVNYLYIAVIKLPVIYQEAYTRVG